MRLKKVPSRKMLCNNFFFDPKNFDPLKVWSNQNIGEIAQFEFVVVGGVRSFSYQTQLPNKILVLQAGVSILSDE